MDVSSITLLLFLVVDPFGNLPFILVMLQRLDGRRYLLAVLREVTAAFVVLGAFLLAGDAVFAWLGVEPTAVSIAGGVILFLISLKMIFESASSAFPSQYGDDPLLVPIAMPSIAGPSAITTVMILKNKAEASTAAVFGALGLVYLGALGVLAAGRPLRRVLGLRGLNAVEKLMGMLLNLIAVSMIVRGVKESFGIGP